MSDHLSMYTLYDQPNKFRPGEITVRRFDVDDKVITQNQITVFRGR